jgi:hypothetical protein
MRYLERQNEWIAQHDLKVGDKVKVLRKAEDYEDGWPTYWGGQTHTMSIGKAYFIQEISLEYGIILDNGWGYPYFVLKPLKEQPPKYKPYKTTMTLTEIRKFFS